MHTVYFYKRTMHKKLNKISKSITHMHGHVHCYILPCGSQDEDKNVDVLMDDKRLPGLLSDLLLYMLPMWPYLSPTSALNIRIPNPCPIGGKFHNSKTEQRI